MTLGIVSDGVAKLHRRGWFLKPRYHSVGTKNSLGADKCATGGQRWKGRPAGSRLVGPLLK